MLAGKAEDDPERELLVAGSKAAWRAAELARLAAGGLEAGGTRLKARPPAGEPGGGGRFAAQDVSTRIRPGNPRPRGPLAGTGRSRQVRAGADESVHQLAGRHAGRGSFCSRPRTWRRAGAGPERGPSRARSALGELREAAGHDSGRGFRRRSCRTSSSRSSPPRRRERGRGWAWRPCTGSSASTGAGWSARASWGGAPAWTSTCPRLAEEMLSMPARPVRASQGRKRPWHRR